MKFTLNIMCDNNRSAMFLVHVQSMNVKINSKLLWTEEAHNNSISHHLQGIEINSTDLTFMQTVYNQSIVESAETCIFEINQGFKFIKTGGKKLEMFVSLNKTFYVHWEEPKKSTWTLPISFFLSFTLMLKVIAFILCYDYRKEEIWRNDWTWHSYISHLHIDVTKKKTSKI